MKRAFAVGLLVAGCREPVAEKHEPPTWQVLASELPAALLSVGGSGKDTYAVGADKGAGPFVLHFDGSKWSQLRTGQRGDLWWVHALPDGHAWMGGAGALLLRYDGHRFERVLAPGLAKQTIYGVWAASADDVYAVGSASGRSGFVWHYRGGAFEQVALPTDLPRTAAGDVPGFFKVFGDHGDVWVVGAAGTILRRTGEGPFVVVPTATKDTLFTVHGNGTRLLTVGGAGNGLALERRGDAFAAVSPAGAGLLQGVFVGEADWLSGERGLIYSRSGTAPFQPVEHGLAVPVGSSLHSIFADAAGGVWSAGGNVLTPALDGGMLLHRGPGVPPVVLDDEVPDAADGGAPVSCPVAVVGAGSTGSIARRWNEQILAAIRLDLPRPTVHARNLFHLSAAMWDVWSAYEPNGNAPHGPTGVFVREHQSGDEAARRTAISHAAYTVLSHRYRGAVGGAQTVACLQAVMTSLGYDPRDAHDVGDGPVAFGNRVAKTIIAQAANDGAYEADDCQDPHEPTSPNAALVYDGVGAELKEPPHWQPINLSVAATQNGIVLPAGVQRYIGSQWGGVTPFAMKRASADVPWHDPGPIPAPGPQMKKWILEVIDKTAAGDPRDGRTLDASPGAYGHNSLGANDGKGWAKNPVTGKPYVPQIVPRGDFARVMAEFWADGPKSETPPGHWNTIANAVADTPSFPRQLFGKGAALDPLAWDVHLYLALNGAVHDAAITAWDLKRRTQTVRPISMVRWMGSKGQSSDPAGPAYDADGLLLAPGLVEIVTKESSAPGQRHAHLAAYVGQVAVRNWLGEPSDRVHQASGVDWVRAVEWIPYQRRTFVTPAFPGFISGHSTFSRAAAEVMAAVTGSPYFPGGLFEFVAPKDAYLTFEKGPSQEVHLQWASYFDASDEAGQSRIWGSIHIEPDDFTGRRLGRQVGLDATKLATAYFEGRVPSR